MLVLHFVLLTILATGSLAVLNGKPATPHQFPYHVGLYWKYLGEPLGKLRFYCGGTVISDSWVLTAAHCRSYRDQLFIKAGKHVVDQEESGEQIRFVVSYIIHPEYKEASDSERLIAQNDIAMIRVNKPFTFSRYVSAAEITNASSYYESGFLAGWGATSLESYVPNFPKELHYNGLLETVNVQDCADTINEATFKSVLSPVEISSNQICTSEGNQGACYKDDGSALVGCENGRNAIIGIVSETILPCGVVQLPTVYARVSAYSKWIKETMDSS